MDLHGSSTYDSRVVVGKFSDVLVVSRKFNDLLRSSFSL